MSCQVTFNGHTIDVLIFRHKLLEWGAAHFRRFPWRETRDPYRILMAELMLRRTRADQVVSVYNEFIGCYPDLMSLADAEPEDILRILYPLGLRWRADQIVALTRILTHELQGVIPVEKEALEGLPGVSAYVASAVRCFAWDLPDAIIDVNTVRVFSRLFDVPYKDSLRRNRTFTNVLKKFVDSKHARDYNLALLDLAHQVCVLRAPLHDACPVQYMCSTGRVS
jgi:A/G-specific adenine glycosylase